jgi:hypothetical protein
LQADRHLKVLLGMIRDDSFGPAVTVGLGGIFACSTTRRYSYRRSDEATCTVRWKACAPATVPAYRHDDGRWYEARLLQQVGSGRGRRWQVPVTYSTASRSRPSRRASRYAARRSASG